MSAKTKSGLVPEPTPKRKVPIGDPIYLRSDGKIHRVVSHFDGDGDRVQSGQWSPVKKIAMTACNLETERFRESYPTKGEPCRKCWPGGVIVCRLDRPRPLVDNTEYYRRNPF